MISYLHKQMVQGLEYDAYYCQQIAANCHEKFETLRDLGLPSRRYSEQANHYASLAKERLFLLLYYKTNGPFDD